MKKQLLFIVIMMMPFKALYASVNIAGINYNLNSSSKTAEVARWKTGQKYAGDIVIPSTVTRNDVEYNVTSIAGSAFSRCPELTSITIPKSVATIGNNVLGECTGLASIVVEEGNPNYDSRKNCNALIETASNKLICGCNGSTIPNGIMTIGQNAFKGCAGLTSVIIPNSVTTIGEDAFNNCTGLTFISIGTGLVNIPYYLFEGCENLKTIEINNNIVVSKNYSTEEANAGSLFSSPANECHIILGEDVTSIGDYAFYGSHITSVKMSDNVTSIGNYAFHGCLITSVELSNNLTYIGKWAFTSCPYLLSVTIPESVRCIDQIAFYWCDRLTKVIINSNEVVARENEQFYTLRSCFGPQVKEFVFGEDVRKIAWIACSESEKLTTVTISSNLTCVEDSAFHKCTSIADVYCYAEQVPETSKDVFVDSNYKSATLHVPANAVEAYKSAEQWKDFGSIVALSVDDPRPTPTAISAMDYAPKTANKAIYDLQGHQLAQPKKGLNIIKMSDGTTKKVVVK